jgi:hypothetical protein
MPDLWAMELQQQTPDRNPAAVMRYIHTDGAVVRMRRLMDKLQSEQSSTAA